MHPARVLVVEDDHDIAEAVAARLRAEGFVVECVHDGLEAVDAARRDPPDLVVLDLMLPGLDGLEVCRRVQAERRTPVIVLTARDDETDLLVGLAVGADDYLTKPFSPRELVARARAVLRRAGVADGRDGDRVMRVANLEVDPDRRVVRRGGVAVHLTPLEFDLVARLAARPGAVCTRDQLLREVWGYEVGGARTVDSHVRSVRRKLGDDVVRTVHGVGYALGLGA